MESTEDIITVLGGRSAVGSEVHDARSLLRRIRKGLPYSSYEHVARLLSVNLREMGEVLALPKSTRVRRKQSLLRPSESDRLVRLARTLARAQHVLGSLENGAAWLQRRNRALGGEKPLSLLDTEIGERLVEDALGRLEHGVIG